MYQLIIQTCQKPYSIAVEVDMFCDIFVFPRYHPGARPLKRGLWSTHSQIERLVLKCKIYLLVHILPLPVMYIYIYIARCLVLSPAHYFINPVRNKLECVCVFKITPDARIWFQMASWATLPVVVRIQQLHQGTRLWHDNSVTYYDYA